MAALKNEIAVIISDGTRGVAALSFFVADYLFIKTEGCAASDTSHEIIKKYNLRTKSPPDPIFGAREVWKIRTLEHLRDSETTLFVILDKRHISGETEALLDYLVYGDFEKPGPFAPWSHSKGPGFSIHTREKRQTFLVHALTMKTCLVFRKFLIDNQFGSLHVVGDRIPDEQHLAFREWLRKALINE